MSQLIIDPFRFGVVIPPEFASLYESFNPLTIINKQHFVEWFSGKALDSIWTKTDIINTGTFRMVDGIDEGFEIITDAGANQSQIDFNNIRHYNHLGAVAIIKMRRVDAGMSAIGGLAADINSGTRRMWVLNDTNNTFYTLQTKLTAITNVATDVAIDLIFHTLKLAMDGTDAKLFIDGVLKATSTTNLLDRKSQPNIRVISRASGNKHGRCNYFEAFNT